MIQRPRTTSHLYKVGSVTAKNCLRLQHSRYVNQIRDAREGRAS
jgi:hypothetical protein